MDAAIRYNSEPPIRRPVAFAAAMLRDLKAARELAWRLFLRDLKAKYRASILGYIWVVLPPLVVTATFMLLQNAKLMNVGELPAPYALYVLSGTTFWQLFADAVQGPLKIVSQSKGMLVKINFPRESLIMAGAMDALFTFAIRFILLLATFAYFETSLPLHSGLVLLPLAVIGMLVAGLAIGVLVTPLGTLFQDFSQGLPLALSLWLIATPIAYPASNVSGLITRINSLNPMTPLIEVPRNLLLSLPNPSYATWGAIIAIATAASVAAWLLFRISLPHIIARIGS